MRTTIVSMKPIPIVDLLDTCFSDQH